MDCLCHKVITEGSDTNRMQLKAVSLRRDLLSELACSRHCWELCWKCSVKIDILLIIGNIRGLSTLCVSRLPSLPLVQTSCSINWHELHFSWSIRKWVASEALPILAATTKRCMFALPHWGCEVLWWACLSVCLSACLSDCMPAYVSQLPNIQTSQNVPYMLVPMAVAQSYDDSMLCPFGFVHAVMFAHNEPHGTWLFLKWLTRGQHLGWSMMVWLVACDITAASHDKHSSRLLSWKLVLLM